MILPRLVNFFSGSKNARLPNNYFRIGTLPDSPVLVPARRRPMRQLTSASRPLVIALALVVILAAPAVQAQSFEILGGVDPVTGESWVFTSEVLASYSGDVLYGQKAGGPHGLLIDGTFRPLTLPDGARVTNMSGDGRVLVGRQRVNVCSQEVHQCNVPFAYYIDEERFEYLEFPSLSGTRGVGFGTGNHSLYISYDGSIIAGYFQIRYPEETIIYSYQWVNGVQRITWDGSSFWAISGISGDGMVLAGMANDFAAVYDGTVKQLPVPSGAAFSSGATQMSPDGKTFAYTVPDGQIFRNPYILIDGQLNEIGVVEGWGAGGGWGHALFVADEGMFYLGTENTRNGRHATLWTPELGIGWLIDVFVNHYEFDLSQFRLASRSAFLPTFHTPPGVIYGVGQGESGRIAWRAVLVPREDELVVNSAADRSNVGARADCDTGESVEADGELVPECTLRAAMEVAAERNVRDSISVNIPGNGPHIINLTSSLPALSSPLVIDATTQPGFNGPPLITINGGGSDYGFVLDQGESTLRGLGIGGFSEAGVYITGPGGNIIENSFIGLDASGTTVHSNGIGIQIENSADNVIGRITTEQSTHLLGNVISGNANQGILIQGDQSENNIIAGNFIGTDYTGSNSIGNVSEGIKIDGSPRNIIGGRYPNERNVISGNLAHGIYITGSTSSENRIEGNFIGLTAMGNSPLGNGKDTGIESGHTGIFIEYAGNTIIGGTTASSGVAPGNIVSGNASHGILITGDASGENAGSADHTSITGNLIGLDAAGTSAISNGGIGILLQGSVRDAKIGESGGSNIIITENLQSGIALLDAGEAAGAPDRTQIQSNILGMTTAAGSPAGEMGPGILVAASEDRTRGVKEIKIGGDDDQGNRISSFIGIYIEGERSAKTEIIGNSIGLLGEGTLAREQIDAVGILVTLADSVQVIDNNVGGQVMGIVLASNDNEVYGNLLGTNPAGISARPNDIGLYIPGEIESGDRVKVGSGNQIGKSERGNTISGNKQIGIVVGGRFNPPGSSGVQVKYTHYLATIDKKMLSSLKANLQEQITTQESANPSLPGSESIKKAAIVNASENQSHLNGIVIAYNRIGTNSAGTNELGNGRSESPEDANPGIFLQDGTGTILFGNTISGNGVGVAIAAATDFSGRPEGTLISGNRIGASAKSMETIPNQYGGILIDQSSHNAVITAPLNEGEEPVANIILGNGGPGIRIINYEGYGESNTIRHTSILENKGPAIDFFNGNSPGSYPAGVPQPPMMIMGTVNDSSNSGSAEFHLRSNSAGSLDLFTSTRCLAFTQEDNEEIFSKPTGDGLYFLSSETAADVTGVISVPLNTLPANPVSLYISSTITSAGENASTSSFSECRRLAMKEDVVVTEIEGDEEEIALEGPGIDVDLTFTNEDSESHASKQFSGSSMNSGGRLYAMRYHLSPDTNVFDGEATAPDGTTIRPDAVSNTRYWTLATDGLIGLTYSVCLDITGLPGAEVPGQLVVMNRENIGHPWVPLPSWLADGSTKLCASGLTAFGDLGIGGAGVFVSTETETPVREEIPSIIALHQNYPNPFNPSTLISFDLPVAGYARVVIYDLMGRSVQTLADGHLSAGSHQVTFDAGRFSSGVYLYRIETAGFTATRKMMLVK